MLQLYFSPLACSLACRIAVYEGGLEAETTFHEVDRLTKRLVDGPTPGADYRAVHPMGQVPALVTADGALLAENLAVLQYLADRAPAARLAPPPTSAARYVLQQWLSFVATEVHKRVFYVVFDPGSPEEARRYARAVAAPRALAHLERTLATRDVLVGDDFTVADAYLVTCLTWARAAAVELEPYPAVSAYRARHAARPHVARAIAIEYQRFSASQPVPVPVPVPLPA